MDELTVEDLKQLVAFYRQKSNDLEYSLLVQQLKTNKLEKEKENINQTLL